jgi:hypothetical protein
MVAKKEVERPASFGQHRGKTRGRPKSMGLKEIKEKKDGGRRRTRRVTRRRKH